MSDTIVVPRSALIPSSATSVGSVILVRMASGSEERFAAHPTDPDGARSGHVVYTKRDGEHWTRELEPGELVEYERLGVFTMIAVDDDVALFHRIEHNNGESRMTEPEISVRYELDRELVDAEMPYLSWTLYGEHGFGWALTYRPAREVDGVDSYFIGGVETDAEWAVERARSFLRRDAEEGSDDGLE